MTCRLFPALQRGAENGNQVRVVSVSSGFHFKCGPDFDDLMFENRDYEKFVSYGQAKSCNILFAVELSKRLQSLGIGNAFSLHPGVIRTGLQRDLSLEEMQAMGWLDDEGNTQGDFWINVEQGAATSCFAATSPLLQNLGGLYLDACDIGQPQEHATNEESASRLWQESEQLVGEVFDFGKN